MQPVSNHANNRLFCVNFDSVTHHANNRQRDWQLPTMPTTGKGTGSLKTHFNRNEYWHSAKERNTQVGLVDISLLSLLLHKTHVSIH